MKKRPQQQVMDPYAGRTDFVDQLEDGQGGYVRPDMSMYYAPSIPSDREGGVAPRGPRDPRFLMDPFSGGEARPEPMRGMMDPFSGQMQDRNAMIQQAMYEDYMRGRPQRQAPPLMDPFAATAPGGGEPALDYDRKEAQRRKLIASYVPRPVPL
jgi:hypothetical protein